MSNESKIDVYLHDILTIRTDKPTRCANLQDVTASNTGAIETLTILQSIPVDVIRESCALLGYYLNLNFSFVAANFPNKESLTYAERTQYETLCSINSFDDYTRRCKAMIERVLTHGKKVYELLQEKKNNGGEDGENRKEKEEIANTYALIHTLDGIFNNFYDLIINDSLPPSMIYERLFLSQCLSERTPLKLYREHLTDLGTLFSVLTKTVIDTTDKCNTLFEAFYGTGILFTILMDIMYKDVSSSSSSSRQIQHWTRVRLLNECDKQSIHFLKNTNTDSYRRTIEHLPTNLFDRQSGLDLYFSKGDTLSTLVLQFIGKIYLRLYEWVERTDVKTYVKEHYVCDNVYTLFANIGRGMDQRGWIRFFKHTHNRDSKVFIKLEPLLTLNDEILANNSEERTALVNKTDGSNTALLASGTAGTQIRANVSQDVAKRYHLFNDFLNRYNEFTTNDRNGRLREHWTKLCRNFVARSNGVSSTDENANVDLLVSLDVDNSPLLSFTQWCNEINAYLFPFNFLLLTGSTNPNDESFDKEALDLAWTLKCQRYLFVKRFTSSKCRQMLTFLQKFEIKSRMMFEEKEFVFLISSAMESMPFLYELFGELTKESTEIYRESNRDHEESNDDKRLRDVEPMDVDEE